MTVRGGLQRATRYGARVTLVVLLLVLASAHRSAAVWSFTGGPLPHRHDHERTERAAAERGGRQKHLSLADHRWQWPSREQVVRVLSMRDYNTRVVMLGTSILGVAAGLVGVFVLLRKRSLVGDVVGHASLPGIAAAFIVMEIISPGKGRSLAGLLTGATLAGLAGVACMTAILRYSRIKEDAALAIVLAVFFGLGIVLFTIIQDLPTGSSAGLNHFIFGTAASMTAADVTLIAWAAAAVLVLCLLFFKELSLLCFDDDYASTQGWPVTTLDLLLMALVVAIVEIGAQSVGLILVVALMIIPAAAARFWTENLLYMSLTAAALGGVSAYLGIVASALMPRLAAGAIIVLVGGALFFLSMFLGTPRGILRRVLTHYRLRRRVGRQDLMRAFYEVSEPRTAVEPETVPTASFWVPFERLVMMRSWTAGRVRQLLQDAKRNGLIEASDTGLLRLTPQGRILAHRATRNHRLWELYLINYADIAPGHVDRDADMIEHILDTKLVEELEAELTEEFPHLVMPDSPHRLRRPVAGTVPDS